jgi:SagB-type dehydrogenase family enzyme
MRIRTASSLIAFPIGRKFAVVNYLTRTSLLCTAEDLTWLTLAPDWTDVDEIARCHPCGIDSAVRTCLRKLTDLGLLLLEGSDAASRDEEYVKDWKMDRAAAFLHFLSCDMAFEDLESSTRAQIEKAREQTPPELFSFSSAGRIQLPGDDDASDESLFRVMRRRRTIRFGSDRAVAVEHIAKCLRVGLGITGFVRTAAAWLPLKMTPSGGARNPFESFVIARNVAGLNTGVYHYAAIDHTLGLVEEGPLPRFADLLGGQDWADSMPVLIILVASLNRTAWKYQDPNAYRVVLIEAGHIAQNIMLACTQAELTACPTAALSHSSIRKLLRLESLADAPLYAMAIGHPASDPDEIISTKEYLLNLRQSAESSAVASV